MDYLTKKVLEECRELLKKHQQLCECIEDVTMADNSEIDRLYTQYWHLLHDNFDSKLLKKVEYIIGHGTFMDEKYIDTLASILNEQPKNIYAFKGYELIRKIDSRGNIVYIPRKNGKKILDSFEAMNDNDAIDFFINTIDNHGQ